MRCGLHSKVSLFGNENMDLFYRVHIESEPDSTKYHLLFLDLTDVRL